MGGRTLRRQRSVTAVVGWVLWPPPLGSSVAGIVYLLSGDFNKIVLSAAIIALPLSYFGIQSWLNNFAYRIELEWWYFIGAVLIALIITWLTVGIHAVRAARVNPVKCLRDE